MPEVCVVQDCNNTPTDKITLHAFPKRKTLARQWSKFVTTKRAHWKETPASKICSQHFTVDLFTNYMKVDLGFAKILQLKANAVPTIWKKTTHNESLIVHFHCHQILHQMSYYPGCHLLVQT